MDTSLSAVVNGQLDREFLSLLPDSREILREDMLARSKYLDYSLKVILSMLHQIHVLLVFSGDWLVVFLSLQYEYSNALHYNLFCTKRSSEVIMMYEILFNSMTHHSHSIYNLLQSNLLQM